MQLPPRMTPAQLRAQLACLKARVIERTLTDWRSIGLLPALDSRGRGRGSGKVNFWRSPKLVEQALAVSELMSLNYPNDEARLVIWLSGFPVKAERAREAWLSRLGKIEANLKIKRAAIIRRRGSEFSDIEDEVSELTTKFARKAASQIGIGQDQVTQIVMDLFGITFKLGYLLDADFLQDQLIDLIMETGLAARSQITPLGKSQLTATIKFVRDHLSFSAIREIASTATDLELNHAHRRWRTILRLARLTVGQMPNDRVAKFVAAGFGRLIVPVIIRLKRNGRMLQVDQSIAEITSLIRQNELAEPIRKLIRGDQISPADKMALRELSGALEALANIWNHYDFPFALHPSK